MVSSPTATRPALWTPGDWNAFFGFGTNILVNLLVLTGLLRFVIFTTRVPVLEGHTVAVAVETERPATPAAAIDAMRAFRADYAGLDLPSAPAHAILVHDDPFRPQPRLDRDAENGMATSVGRVRPEPALPNGLKYVVLSHNTRMGAAQGAVLVAEYLCRTGVI